MTFQVSDLPDGFIGEYSGLVFEHDARERNLRDALCVLTTFFLPTLGLLFGFVVQICQLEDR